MKQNNKAYQLGSADPYTTFSAVDCQVFVEHERGKTHIAEVQDISWNIESDDSVFGSIRLAILGGESSWPLFKLATKIMVKATNEYGCFSAITFNVSKCSLTGGVNINDICLEETIEFLGTNKNSWRKQ